MHIQNFESKIILENCLKAKDMIIYNIFNINLIKFNQLDIKKEKCFFPLNSGSSVISPPEDSAVALLILTKTFDKTNTRVPRNTRVSRNCIGIAVQDFDLLTTFLFLFLFLVQ